MSNALSVKVSSRKNDGQEFWEGSVTLDGVKATKLARKSDGSTRFTSKSAVQGAAKRFADRYGYSDVDFGEKTEAKAVKKAAKKSVKTKATPPAPTV